MQSSQPWSPASWTTRSSVQPIHYAQPEAVATVIDQLNQLPALIPTAEIEHLKKQLIGVAKGNGFLLQGGDCAESFADCNLDTISAKLKLLLQMKTILAQGLAKPIISVGRMAGQYVKPRSSEIEVRANVALPPYRGDLINQISFTEMTRRPNPQLMLQGYELSALTLKYMRTLLTNNLATAPETQASSTKSIELYTCREALHLIYEQALTRQDSAGHWYNTATHFPWLGMRSTSLAGGPVEYLRGIANPIGVKIAPQLTQANLVALLERLNPEDEPGRLTLIHRLGAVQVTELLPEIIKTVKKTGKTVLWVCDPMHGNTYRTTDGIKTRRFSDILFELQQAFKIHQKMQSYLGGVHLELTPDPVTECLDKTRGITEATLKHAYKSLLDPRLNNEQALEISQQIIKM